MFKYMALFWLAGFIICFSIVAILENDVMAGLSGGSIFSVPFMVVGLIIDSMQQD